MKELYTVIHISPSPTSIQFTSNYTRRKIVDAQQRKCFFYGTSKILYCLNYFQMKQIFIHVKFKGTRSLLEELCTTYQDVKWPQNFIKFLIYQVFSSAVVSFSLDGDRYQLNPVKFVPQLEPKESPKALNISVALHNRVGNFLKVHLHFSARWILLSEVSFESGKHAKFTAWNTSELYFFSRYFTFKSADL